MAVDGSQTTVSLRPCSEVLDGKTVFEAGKARAEHCQVRSCAFLTERGISSELDDKRQAIAENRLSFHAQIGYREQHLSRTAWQDIHARLSEADAAPDRYGICLDWSMGYPKKDRGTRPCGTGLILEDGADFSALTDMAPVAPHFGDFMLGMPGAVENTEAALLAGSTTIGNLSQYFTFRLPGWDDEAATTLATVEALGLLAGQERDILIHSNLDDGYAAWFEDMSSALGFALVEKWLIEEVCGLKLGHCWGHTYTDPVKRLAFKCALEKANTTPGTMIYGNTTLYGADHAANYGALAGYLTIDILGQLMRPTGHAITPIPVTEAQRIPSIDEVIDAHLAARRLAARLQGAVPLFSAEAAEELAQPLLTRARAFAGRIKCTLPEAGVDMEDPAQIMLTLKQTGPARLEAAFADPFDGDPSAVTSPFVDEILFEAEKALTRTSVSVRQTFAARRPKIVVATTDVHFYGKRLIETVLDRLNADWIDGGVSVDADDLATLAVDAGADAIAVSTYNGVALSYARQLKAELAVRGAEIPIFLGGRLNEIMEDADASLPVEVDKEVQQAGVTPCTSVEEMLAVLADRPHRVRA